VCPNGREGACPPVRTLERISGGWDPFGVCPNGREGACPPAYQRLGARFFQGKKLLPWLRASFICCGSRRISTLNAAPLAWPAASTAASISGTRARNDGSTRTPTTGNSEPSDISHAHSTSGYLRSAS